MNNKAFTLVEIMVVVAIIALLAAIAIPNMLRARVQANEATAQSTLKTIASAMETYATINNVYPSNTALITNATPPYLSKDYFTGTHAGYSFVPTLDDYSYSVTALPASSGVTSYTVTTGAIFASN